MFNKTVFIIFFMLVSAGLAFLSSTEISAEPGNPFIITESYIEEGLIKAKHNDFGAASTYTFEDPPGSGNYVTGIMADVWVVEGPIGVDDDIGARVGAGSARKRSYSSELYGQGNPTYGCGWICFFWP